MLLLRQVSGPARQPSFIARTVIIYNAVGVWGWGAIGRYWKDADEAERGGGGGAFPFVAMPFVI